MVLIFLVFIILIGLDQLTKYLAISFLKGNESIPIIKNIFELSYVENKGAAFGIFQNKGVFLTIIALIILGIIICYYRKIPNNKKYNIIRFTLILIMTGAIGNVIDRVLYGYVVDFLYFKLIDFPVFNMADSYVSIGAFLLLFLVIFVYKDDELFQSGDKKEDYK